MKTTHHIDPSRTGPIRVRVNIPFGSNAYQLACVDTAVHYHLKKRHPNYFCDWIGHDDAIFVDLIISVAPTKAEMNLIYRLEDLIRRTLDWSREIEPRLLPLIAAVKEHARQNYAKSGWDYVVECWTDEDIAGTIKESGARSAKGAIKACKSIANDFADRRSDVINA
jgi:hypothetical protein